MSGAAVRVVILATVVLGCGADADSSPLESTLERLRERHLVQDIEGWTVTGLRLVSVERDGPNPLGRRWVVGIDEATGEVVEGAALMARIPATDPSTLAERALSVLVERHGTLPLRSGDERDDAIPEAEWSLVVAPIRSDTALVFWAVVEQSTRILNEYRLETAEWSLEWREAGELLRAGEAGVDRGPSFCEAVSRCGCWAGCVRVQPTNDPRLPDRIVFRALDPPHRGERLLRAACQGSACPRVCVSPPGTTCVGALVPAEAEVCAVSCSPTTASFHCETAPNACRTVPHPARGQP